MLLGKIKFSKKNRELIKIISQCMEEIKVDPAIIYAFKRTGMMVVIENVQCFSPVELEEWHDSIDDYLELNEILSDDYHYKYS
jgi:hypothetical protein